MIAGHTRTSLLRTLNSSGRFSPNEWLLPETKQLFQLQVERQRDMAKRIEKKEEVRTKRSKKLLKANQMSSKQWLSRHGLLTQRLTILDALGSTFVPHRPKYISILDKHVMSKVFDEVLPIAHVSKSQQVRLVNPNGVNLKDYETKLQAALDKYRQRLNTIVWNALSEDAKEQFDSSTPVDFEENTEKLYRLLEEADWPVREQDVSLLAREIARAQKFLGQSQALRKAAAGEGDDDDDEEDEEDDDERDDKSDQGKEEDNEPPVSSARSNSPRSNKSEASPTRSEAGSKDDEVSLRRE
ncbi:von Willebrand factor A domain-containing protein 3B [Aplysia californica]|uniref:von Willebrand factor A domain-containing protein 3B n=1 Tax=Aplysia californica TaxID=6500 RepID=A0ABM1AFA8_APLCA|nr:von Willebrand factor A domain-containing protein 3B [Aplysia californica]